VSTPTLIGVTAPGGAYTARYLHWGDHPQVLVPMLRRIWSTTFATDTAAMTAAVLARDWSSLDADARRGRLVRETPIRGVGYPAPSSEPTPRTGALGENVDGFLEWLYLVAVATDTVVVYEATRHDRWLRHSRHRLNPGGELFEPYHPPADGALRCTVCGAVDETEHVEVASMLGYGRDTSTRCTRCGSVETTDPMFGAHTDRAGQPPATDLPR
jgi:hypothetical protein